MQPSTENAIVHRIEKPLDIASFDADVWDIAEPVSIDRNWSGQAAPEERLTQVRHLWSDDDLYVRFDATQREPLVFNDHPDLSKKTISLWERDVCEIFIAPDASTPNKYFEFEIAPTGEWLDLAIVVRGGERIIDWGYSSRMRSAAVITDERVRMAMAIPFATLGRTPRTGDVWLGNIFRCVGSGASRGYLAWQPTSTPQPNFHIPAAFGRFIFE